MEKLEKKVVAAGILSKKQQKQQQLNELEQALKEAGCNTLIFSQNIHNIINNVNSLSFSQSGDTRSERRRREEKVKEREET